MMHPLLSEICDCRICEASLPLGPRPVLAASPNSRIAIIGQAPGTKVHQSGIPWDDASGKQLRAWMQVSDKEFYDPELFAIIPMGFCYPGKGKSGDLPPRKECAPQWHALLWEKMPQIELVLLIGQYAQAYYLPETAKLKLTERVMNFEAYGPRFLPLPHPSPRNRFWLKKNPWFEESVLPVLRTQIQSLIK